MKKTFDCSLLYSDTDSLFYKIRGQDFYEKTANDPMLQNHFDFSNYPNDSPLHCDTNKMVTLKFKDEMAGKVIREFVGLKPKMYSIVYENQQKMSAKGVSRFAQSSLKHDVYKRVLLSGHHMRSNNIRIGSSKHLLQTIRNNKISLSAFDDKRFIQNDGIYCLPFGHFEIRDWQLHREILEDDDWGDEEREEAPETSPTWSTLIRDFTVSPSSNVPSLSNYDADRERSHHEVETQISDEIFTPPDPGMHQRDYSESELDEVTDFGEQTTAYSSPRQRNPFIEDEAEEDSFRDFDSDYDDVTINYSPLNDLSPLRSPSLLDISPPKGRRVVIISSDNE